MGHLDFDPRDAREHGVANYLVGDTGVAGLHRRDRRTREKCGQGRVCRTKLRKTRLFARLVTRKVMGE